MKHEREQDPKCNYEQEHQIHPLWLFANEDAFGFEKIGGFYVISNNKIIKNLFRFENIIFGVSNNTYLGVVEGQD